MIASKVQTLVVLNQGNKENLNPENVGIYLRLVLLLFMENNFYRLNIQSSGYYGHLMISQIFRKYGQDGFNLNETKCIGTYWE